MPLFSSLVVMLQRTSGRAIRYFSQSAKAHPIASASSIQTSVLENNVIVATKGPETEMVTFGVSLAAGSRYEIPSTPGLAHFFKHSLFLSNQKESSLALTRLQELRGSNISVSLNRDLVTITAQCTRDNLLDTLQSVGYMLHPKRLEHHELKLLAEQVAFERDLVFSDAKCFLLEQIQSVAYRDMDFGKSVICSKEYESLATSEKLLNFFLRTMAHDGTSAVGVGIRHDVFARALPKIFEGIHYSAFGNQPHLPPIYHGGEARFEAASGKSSAIIAFPLPGGNSDAKTLALSSTIAKLLIPTRPVQYGSQNSIFLKNGAFKGVSSFTGNAQLYSNAGLVSFILEGGSRDEMKEALSRIKSAPSIAISEEDLARAKIGVLFDLRSKYDNSQQFIATASEQIVGSGKVFDIASVHSELDALSMAHVKKAIEAAFNARPSLATFGNSRELPYLDELA